MGVAVRAGSILSLQEIQVGVADRRVVGPRADTLGLQV